ncbi:MAG: HAD family hydrolase [Verrucomicrobiaceae bacterium]|nr:MAG: HAD family hydrolase [Verrucomicrobiaceae bacterium]
MHSPVQPRPQISHLVFDFDGTLSWLRHGWPEIMCGVFHEQWALHFGEPDTRLREHFLDEILALNGKPSIFQSRRFVELLSEAGGPDLDAEVLREEFQCRLDTAITERIASIRGGGAAQDAYLVAGAREFLEHVCSAGLCPIILSTTAEERVREEAGILGIAHYFGRHIYGGTGDPLRFSKYAVFERLLREERIAGDQLLSFGDGPVELRDTKQLGGLAVGVCSDETVNGSGRVDRRKQAQLLAVGADAILPDFRDAASLLGILRGV